MTYKYKQTRKPIDTNAVHLRLKRKEFEKLNILKDLLDTANNAKLSYSTVISGLLNEMYDTYYDSIVKKINEGEATLDEQSIFSKLISK